MNISRLAWFIVLSFILFSCSDEPEKAAPVPPNIIYILADDLGYGELGCYGQQKIETPNIDQLAKEGMRFTQHYTGAPVCAPARCVFLTGKHSGHAYVRSNDEWDSRGDIWNYQAMFDDPSLEGQAPIPDSIVTVAELLKESGYQTACIGKWGLGAPGTEAVPNKQGFDFFYGYNCQRQAHTLYPMHLWKNEERVLLKNKNVAPHTYLEQGADPYDPKSYERFELEDYAPELMHREAIQFVETNKSNPFFLYYASPLPHVPLQAPARWVDHYHKIFGKEEPYVGDPSFPYFPNQKPKATYAAMISYLDEQVGDLVDQLKTLGIYENTVIIFTSDNGPTYAGGTDTPFFDSAKPFKTEFGWGKGFVHEGGIRVPFIASWPGRIAPATVSTHLSAFQDMLPTFCDLAAHSIPPGTDGISMLNSFLGKPQKEHKHLYWEFPSYKGQQAIRLGKWKGIRKNILEGNMKVELYDLEKDIQEQTDLAIKFPQVVAQIEKIMADEHVEASTASFRMKALGDN